MTIPLDRLRDFFQATPPPGQVSLAVARHEAPVWPSPEVVAYARDRSRLLHDLVDDTGTRVVSWGETDSEHPREVVEVVLELVPALTSALAVVLAARIGRPPAAPRRGGRTGSKEGGPPRSEATVPGFSLRRSDGAVLQVTYRDGLRKREIERMVEEFLAGEG